MRIQRPLFWHQGLFLQPQHFQLQDLALRSQLAPLLKHLRPHFWGVGKLEIDEGALGTGAFRLHSGSFLFPDGTYAELPGNALLDPRPCQGHLQDGKPLQVYLGLKRWNEDGENVTVIASREEAASATTRFVTMADPEEVKDLHGGGPDGQVKRLTLLLKVFWESELESLGDYLLIPLARLEESGGVGPSRRFIPPALALDATDHLLRLVREIRDLVAARTLQLEQYKKQRGVQSAELISRDMVYLLTLMTLNRHLPQLSHLIETPSLHPWDAYGLLRQLVGELSSFSPSVSAGRDAPTTHQQLPSYDHRNLWHCFSAGRDLLTRLLDEITAGPDHVLRLIKDGDCYRADLKRQLLEGTNRFYLALKTGQSSQLQVRDVESVAKLSAREQLPLLNSRALPGVGLQFLQLPPQELPRRSDTLYFAVDHHHEQWAMIEQEKNIAFYWDDAPADLEVDLLVVEQLQQG